MLDLKEEQKCQYEAKVTSMAAALGFKVRHIPSLTLEPPPSREEERSGVHLYFN